MSQAKYIREFDGFVRGVLDDTLGSYIDQIRYALVDLDGHSSWGYSIWRAPLDADLLEDIPESDEYIQCAGSSDALTIEVRTLDSMGVAHQYAVGKADPKPGEAPTEIIRWDEGRHSTTVFPSEVFTADEAVEVFYGYFLNNQVAESYTLRELDLGDECH